MTVELWGQILLAFAGGFTSLTMTIAGAIVWRMKANATRQIEHQRAEVTRKLEQQRAEAALIKAESDRKLEQQRIQNEIALKEAEARTKDLEAKAHERVLAAEGEIRSMADNTALLTRLVDHLSESSKRTSHDAEQHREGLTRLIQASVESTDTLKTLVVDMGSVKTNLGEHSIVLEAVRQIVAGLPTQLDDKTNPLIEVIKLLVMRINTVLDGLDGAKKQLAVDLIAAIRETLLQMQSQAVTIPHLPSNPVLSTEESS